MGLTRRQIKSRLRYYGNNPEECANSDEYYSFLLGLIDYQDKIDFSEYEFLLGYQEDGVNLYTYSPQRLLLGKAYGNDLGEELISIYNEIDCWPRYYFIPRSYLITDHYAEYYSKEQLEVFIKFLIDIGVKTGFEIVKQDAWHNPLFYEKLYSSARRSHYYENYDWTIYGLEEILKKKSFALNLQIWNSIKEKRSEWYTDPSVYMKFTDYCTALHQENLTDGSRTCESSLIYYLKKYDWIPDQEGNFYKPTVISLDKIHKDFVYDEYSPILKALKIGSCCRDNVEKSAGKVISTEDYEFMIKFLQESFGCSSIEEFRKKISHGGDQNQVLATLKLLKGIFSGKDAND